MEQGKTERIRSHDLFVLLQSPIVMLFNNLKLLFYSWIKKSFFSKAVLYARYSFPFTKHDVISFHSLSGFFSDHIGDGLPLFPQGFNNALDTSKLDCVSFQEYHYLFCLVEAD